MSAARLQTIFADQFFFTLRRPMLWCLVLVTAFLAWGLSTGDLRLGTGSATVGGRQAWITSEFSNAFVFCIVVSVLYAFFVSVAAGLAVIRDQEHRIEELLHTTPLRPSEYAWGKALGLFAAFGGVLVLHLLLTILFNHGLPNPAAEEIRGPFDPLAYLRPAALFALPTMAFFGGLTLYLGARLRRPAFAFLVPLATVVVCFAFFWEWAPTWLDPRIDRWLMILDPSGFRWLNETWLKLDRGADFYNTATVGLDGVFLANRLLCLALGILGVVLAQRHVAGAAALGAGRSRSRRRWLRRRPQGVEVAAAETSAPASLEGRLAMRQTPVSLLGQTLVFAGAELRAVSSSPALYLFWVFVLSQSLSSSLLARGPFQTALLMTSGQHATGAFNTLSIMICFLLLVFTVDALGRDRACGVQSIIDSTPHATGAHLLGKNLALNGLAGMILIAAFLAGSLHILLVGEVTPRLTPYLVTWGFLMMPTFLLWTAFLSAIHALGRSRYLTLGLGLGALAWTLFETFTDRPTWLSNWLLWDGPRWSDFGLLELDRRALVLNRLLALTLAASLLWIATVASRRREVDGTRWGQLLSAATARRLAPRLAPALLMPILAALPLWLAVRHSTDGEAARQKSRDYWRQNYATWKEAPQPSIAAADVSIRLEPSQSGFQTAGTFELRNHHSAPLRRFALSAGSHWQDLRWTVDGRVAEPENRSGLHVFEVEGGMQPGDALTVGFTMHGNLPSAISRGGGTRAEFILPSGVVLTSFGPSFVPTVGFDPERGVGKENTLDPPDPIENPHLRQVEPSIGGAVPYPVRLTIDTPEDYLSNGVGVLESETLADGRRVRIWATDHPVRMFNVVAGRWNVHEGESSVIYHHPDHHHNVEAMSRVLDASREHYSRWFAPYPWRELKLSEFPAHATYAQGFATNITFSESVGFLTRPDARSDAVMLVTAHEAAHQWWGNLLTPGKGPGGGVLSEGMAHFSALLLFEELAGPAQRMELAKRLEEAYGTQRRRDAERPLVQIDGSRPGDSVVTYNKGGWVAWMLLEHLGREPMLEGLREFIRRFGSGPDHPLLEDLVETLRPYAADSGAFDAFVEQWLFDVVLPELRFSETERRREGDRWVTTALLTHHGTGTVELEVAAVVGDRLSADREATPYQAGTTSLRLAPGESRSLRLVTDFEPQRLVADPDVKVLMLRRKEAEVAL